MSQISQTTCLRNSQWAGPPAMRCMMPVLLLLCRSFLPYLKIACKFTTKIWNIQGFCGKALLFAQMSERKFGEFLVCRANKGVPTVQLFLLYASNKKKKAPQALFSILSSPLRGEPERGLFNGSRHTGRLPASKGRRTWYGYHLPCPSARGS